MKIVIIGYSGSGKSTLAKILGKHYNIPVLHLDSVNFLSGWNVRDEKETNEIVMKFIEENESWIIDGNYYKIARERFELADKIIFLNYNRFFCLKSVIKRYKENIGRTRSDMAAGCEEKLDFEFLYWVFIKGRNKNKRNRFKKIVKNHNNSLVFKNRKQLFNYFKDNNIKYNL
jgi:adenylate kinase family enzyme